MTHAIFLACLFCANKFHKFINTTPIHFFEFLHKPNDQSCKNKKEFPEGMELSMKSESEHSTDDLNPSRFRRHRVKSGKKPLISLLPWQSGVSDITGA